MANDTEREQWVENDEGLYNWRLSEHLSVRAFVRAHRAEIDKVIGNVVEGREQAHYLAYPGPVGRRGQSLLPRAF